MKNSIKREQSQACLNFAERKNFRLQAKYKILMTLALLLTAATGAWADGISVTTEDFGKVICTDGSIYATEGEATAASKTAAAKIFFIDNVNKKGLALALADESGAMDWSTAKTTAAIGGGKEEE